ncbi:MAG: PilZ domain-containing protein [Candidatus Omnitrophota bacterium]
MEERRVFKRFDVDIPVKFLIVEENKEGMGKIMDISAGGVGLVITFERMQPFMHLELWLQLPDTKEPFHTSGKVMWLRQVQPAVFRVGIQFDKVDFMGMSKVLRAKGVLRDSPSL